ncbi:protein kinase [bacterium]|nr:protein kinase [bacterium]
MNVRVERIASRIADGLDVDWEREREDGETTDRQLGSLRALDRISSFHRDLPTDADAEETTTISLPDGAPTGSSGTITAWGGLEIRRRLGEGAFGEVYHAFDPGLQRDVALKLFKTANKEQVLREGRALARVRHPNVLVVHGVDEHDDRVGLWMDLLRGSDLREVVSEQGTLGPQEAALVGIDLCRALAALHQAGLVHRDVKPSNVMRETGGRIVLLDFGASCDPDALEHRVVHGTPLFIAPEIWRGESGASVRSDLYALGVLLFWLVTAAYPVEGRTVPEVRDAHESGRIRRIRDVRADLPTGFVRVIDRALESDPSKRYATAGEMEADLVASVGAVGSSPPPALHAPEGAAGSGPGHAGHARRWRWWLAAALGILAIEGSVLVARRVAGPGLDAEALLYLHPGGAAAGEVRPFARGEDLRVGDAFHLEVEADDDLNVYVLSEDETGTAVVLFPLQEDDNPLPGGVRHRLPGLVEQWEVSSAGGEERLVVVAAAEPLRDFARVLASLPHATDVRGVNRMTRADPATPGRLAELIAPYRGSRASRVWEFRYRSGDR